MTPVKTPEKKNPLIKCMSNSTFRYGSFTGILQTYFIYNARHVLGTSKFLPFSKP